VVIAFEKFESEPFPKIYDFGGAYFQVFVFSRLLCEVLWKYIYPTNPSNHMVVDVAGRSAYVGEAELVFGY